MEDKIAESAVDLAGKWGDAIAQKLSESAPHVADIATEAAMVNAIGNVSAWLGMLILFLASAIVGGIFAKKEAATERRYDDAPVWGIASGAVFVVSFIALVGLMVTFPLLEIGALYSPRGYTALMLLQQLR